MKGPGIPSRCELPEHTALEAKLCFDHKVQEVVGHQGVVARSRAHHEVRQPWTVGLYRVPPLAYSLKDECHSLYRYSCRLTIEYAYLPS